MTKSTTTKPLYIASDKPGGYLPSPELDRANAFASMRLALEAVASSSRNEIPAAVRAAVVTFPVQFESHGAALLASIANAQANGRPRDLEAAVDAKVAFFAHAESATLTTAPKQLDAAQIHAAALAQRTLADADKHRVRYTNY